MVKLKLFFAVVFASLTIPSLFSAIHDWELGERQAQRNYRIAPESIKTETALYHGECVCNQS
jgi:hypothetical protein